MNKTQTLDVRCDEQFSQAIREAAARNNMTISAYVRHSIALCLSLGQKHYEAIEILADIASMTEGETMASLLTGAIDQAYDTLTGIVRASETQGNHPSNDV